MSLQLAMSIGTLITTFSSGCVAIAHAIVYVRTSGKYGNGYAEKRQNATIGSGN